MTCSDSCRMKLRWQDPRYRAHISKALKNSPACYSDERKKQLDSARTQRTFGPAYREKLRTAAMIRHQPTKLTNIERQLRDAFRKMRLDFVMHATLFNRWQPDFVFEQAKLIVQADGDYWHAKPEVQERDARFNARAMAEGWTIWRFSGTAIETNVRACAKAVAGFVRSTQATLPLTIHVNDHPKRGKPE